MPKNAIGLARLKPNPAAGRPPRSAQVLDRAVAEQTLDLAETFRTIASKYGKTYQQILLEIAKTAFGPGRLSYDEYLALRLFDDAALAGADKAAFVGLDASRRIWTAANHNTEWWGVMRNKLAATTLLGGYGFPVIATVALYSETLRIPAVPTVREPAELASLLRTCKDYPLFGKPMDSFRSLGSASFEGYEASSDSLLTITGEEIALERFVADVAAHYGGGYLLQCRLDPHPAVRALVGNRLATVRVMTMLTRDGPEILRAAWKIPAGNNIADNFWRPGNLLATLDLDSGRVIRVVCGSGLSQQAVMRHPDTGAELIGIEVPLWRPLTKLALEAAAALNDVPLIGWDMAATERGAVIVEPNFTPDFIMPQIADRRGILDGRFADFLDQCRTAARLSRRRERFGHLAEMRQRLRRLAQSLAGA
jgi:hypothetical protein